MYWREIIGLIVWPVSIYIAYRIILVAIRFFEKRHPDFFTDRQDDNVS